MDVGASLRNARERRGLAIESLSRITRIKPDLLRAIEANAFEKVPGGIFLRGFLRSYAREVGLDPDSVVRWYAEEFETAPADPPALVAAPPRNPLSDLPNPRVFETSRLRPLVDVQWAAVAIIVLAFAGYMFVGPRLTARPSWSAPSIVAAGQGNAEVQPAVAAQQQQAAPGTAVAVGTSGAVLQVDIAPTGPCWISADADGQRVAYGLLQSGDRRAIAVHDGLVLRVGDPATFRYTLNGVPGRTLGGPAEPVTVTIAPANFRDFVAR